LLKLVSGVTASASGYVKKSIEYGIDKLNQVAEVVQGYLE